MVDTLLPGITAHLLTTPRYTAQVLERPAVPRPPHGAPCCSCTATCPRRCSGSRRCSTSPRTCGRSRSTSAASAAARRCRSTRRGASATTPTTSRRSSSRSGSTRCTSSAGAWAAASCCSACSSTPVPVASVTLVNPVSPLRLRRHGRADGRLVHAGCRGLRRRGSEPRLHRPAPRRRPHRRRAVVAAVGVPQTYVKPPFTSEHDDLWVESMLTTAIGEDNYPGDATSSENWPGFAPGDRGRAQHDGADHVDVRHRAPRGEAADPVDPRRRRRHRVRHVALRPQHLGDARRHPGVAGGGCRAAAADDHADAGRARSLPCARRTATRRSSSRDCGHSPHLECPEQFREALLAHLDGSDEAAA